MKTLLVIAVALTTVATAPAFAAQARSQQGYERNDNANRDFQLGGARWKTNHKHHRAHQTSK
jgi:Ni/Co efflux regulator RcnB